MKYGIIFSFFSALLIVAALTYQGWYLWLSWPAISFAIVAVGYLHRGPGVYGKSAAGLLSPLSQFVLLPFLLYLWVVWHFVRLVKSEPAYHRLTDTVLIGRRLLSHEFPETISHVIDLTCEFNEPRALRSTSYHSFQILDGSAPTPDQLVHWIRQTAALTGNVYIHCAEGHGRTGLFAAALLLQTGHSKTIDDALQFIQSTRPQARLARGQLAVLRAAQFRDPPGSSRARAEDC